MVKNGSRMVLGDKRVRTQDATTSCLRVMTDDARTTVGENSYRTVVKTGKN